MKTPSVRASRTAHVTWAYNIHRLGGDLGWFSLYTSELSSSSEVKGLYSAAEASDIILVEIREEIS